jgi:hypothetical protein
VDGLDIDQSTVVELERLAVAVGAHDPAATLAAVDSLAAKDTTRRQAFLRWVIATARGEAAQAARRAATAADPFRHRVAVEQMAAADRADAALARQANPSVVLWALWPGR